MTTIEVLGTTCLFLGIAICFWHRKVVKTRRAKLWAEIELEYIDLCAQVEGKHHREIMNLTQGLFYKSREDLDWDELYKASGALVEKQKRQYQILKSWRQRQFYNRYYFKDEPLMHL